MQIVFYQRTRIKERFASQLQSAAILFTSENYLRQLFKKTISSSMSPSFLSDIQLVTVLSTSII